MKKGLFLLMAGFLFFSLPAEAQLLKKIKKGAEKAAERAVIYKTEQKVTKETEKAMDTLLGNSGSSNSSSTPVTGEGSQTSSGDVSSTSVETSSGGKDKTWSKYNFVPGDEIIFEDDLAREENGEFPSRWDLVHGNAENASLGGQNIITLDNRSIITPLMDKEDYLPEVFTVEFDAYFNDTYSHWQEYIIRFYPGDDNERQVRGDLVVFPLRVNKNGAYILSRANKENKEFKNQGPHPPDGTAGWKHIAISYNQRALKVFINEERILNVPNIELDPKVISIQAEDSQKDHIIAIKNIKIAEGGKKLYDRIIAEGKFVTRGILFDVNKASLKPESMGVINEIAALMKEHTDLKFSIEGHTDSDGEESNNLKLSEQRALSVKEALAGLGIDASRMQPKGLGETVPVSDNTTPEGKANNRRVEFVKI